MDIQIRAIISGTVQGVFFRASTLEEAQRLNLAGSVQNLPDGSVEMVAIGEKDRVESLLKWAHHGPPDAVVTEVRIQSETPDAEPGGFRIIK